MLIWGIAHFFPQLQFAISFKDLLATLIAMLGIVITSLGWFSFRKAGTTVNPLRPEQASALVITGIYRFSRNPMYLGFAMGLVAWVVYLSAWAGLLAIGAFVAYMNRFQIEPEERALESRFGQAFVDYKRRVRRWL